MAIAMRARTFISWSGNLSNRQCFVYNIINHYMVAWTIHGLLYMDHTWTITWMVHAISVYCPKL